MCINKVNFKSSHPEVFLGKGVLQFCSKFAACSQNTFLKFQGSIQNESPNTKGIHNYNGIQTARFTKMFQEIFNFRGGSRTAAISKME